MRALTAGLVAGLVACVLVLSVRTGDMRQRADRLEVQVIEAEEREVVMAERLIKLTEGLIDQREVVDTLSSACVTDGWCAPTPQEDDRE